MNKRMCLIPGSYTQGHYQNIVPLGKKPHQKVKGLGHTTKKKRKKKKKGAAFIFSFPASLPLFHTCSKKNKSFTVCRYDGFFNADE